MLMRRLIGALLLVTFLNGCAQLPLVSTLEGTLSVNGAIAGVTGKYEHQAASAVVNMASHKSTGKTVGEHLYVLASNKYTKKTLEDNFPNQDLSIDGYWKGLDTDKKNTIVAPIKSTIHAPVKLAKSIVKSPGFNYRALVNPFPSLEDIHKSTNK